MFFKQLLDILKFYFHFEICQATGDPLKENEVMQAHYDKMTSLQVCSLHVNRIHLYINNFASF